MNLQEVVDLDKKYYMNTFGDRTPLCFTHGKGSKLFDTQGKEYLDLYAGIAVSALGHAHPILINAIKEQAEKLIHCSNIYYIEAQAKLAQLVVENSCADKVFFGNSGAEANEGAIKLARLYFKKKNQPEKNQIITLVNSFHGRTMATISATGQEKFQKPFTPLVPGFVHVPINDILALGEAVNPNTCAIMLELIQGESGVNPVSQDYLQEIKTICKEHNILLIIDEIQTGIGRTGTLFAYENFGIEPDIFTLAKGLGGGVPIGAVCAKQFVADAFAPSDHGSTFGGNPLACAAGVAVMETIKNDKLLDNAKEVGAYFIEKLQPFVAKYSLVSEIRGKAFMIGVQLTKPLAKEIRAALQDKGFLVGNVGESIIRMLPPLILTKAEVDSYVEALNDVLQRFENN